MTPHWTRPTDHGDDVPLRHGKRDPRGNRERSAQFLFAQRPTCVAVNRSAVGETVIDSVSFGSAPFTN
jgi:hypothetical protein